MISALTNENWDGTDNYESKPAIDIVGAYGHLLQSWDYVEAGFPQGKASAQKAEELGVEQESIGCFLGTVSDIRWVQENLPGYYAVHPYEDMAAVYTGLFCLGVNQDRNTLKATEELVKLLYSDGAQTILSVQGNSVLPLASNAHEAFGNTYSDFRFVDSGFVDELNIFGESWYRLPEN